KVKKGELLAELSNATQKAQVGLAKAEVGIAKADLLRLKNGERPEKRKAIAANEEAKRVLHESAAADFKRAMKGGAGVSLEAKEMHRFAAQRTKIEWEQASAERALIEAPPRHEDVAAAEGRVAAAEGRLRLAEADLAKTRLLAPCDATVLQLYIDPGDLARPTSAQPILLLADLSLRKVRAFVEELDIAHVRVGQEALISVDGFADREFSGKVTEVIPRMGKRAPQSDRPTEYKDLYYREV